MVQEAFIKSHVQELQNNDSLDCKWEDLFMISLITKFTFSLFISLAASVGYSQYAMEQYIPIGQSIGVSLITSVIGTIESVDIPNKFIQVNAEGVVYSIDLSGTSHGPVDYWIDNSRNGRTNTIGKPSDISLGSIVEVRFADNSVKPNLNAVWVKILGPEE
jgi:hypothetical protein